MKTKYANIILMQIIESMVNDERITKEKGNLIKRIFEDLIYDGKIRINHYLEYYYEYFEKLNTLSSTTKNGEVK